MQIQVEVRREDVEPLRTMAVDDHRSLREQAGYLLHLKIREDALRRKVDIPETLDEAEVAVG
jgi:hypothetical protein